jgi:hypothetical protein
VNPGMQWEVVQVKDTVTQGHPRFNAKAHYAKSVASHNEKLTCYGCHTSWMTSCSGCHLPQEQNAKSAMQHYEGTETRNYASYNPQVIRTDAFMLGINSPIKGAKIAPVRSSSALVISSTNQQRQRIYIQQPPIAASGYSSQAFNPHVPHTVRTKETQGCGSCHLTEANDNNAWLAQVLLQGTNFVNFIGRFAWIATGHEGFEAVAVTEWDEPQAVIGSSLHKIVYPDWYAAHQKAGKELKEAHHHHAHDARSIQLRGEYLFVANGEGGFEAYDVANVDNKDFSERIVSAPVSPFGQRTFVKTKFAAAVALPSTMPMDPLRKTQFIPENQEQPIHPLYRYAYIADREEGLILVDVTTLTDGNPSNNFFTRSLTWNPERTAGVPPASRGASRAAASAPDETSAASGRDARRTGLLTGANAIHAAGRWLLIGTDKNLVIVDIDKPLQPRVLSTTPIDKPTGIAVQFRYAFVTGAKGLHTIDITDPAKPRLTATVPINDARNLYVARTYAYVAGGKEGVVIVDVEKPEKPFIDQVFHDDLHDVNDVKVASTNASAFAYVADGEHGLKIVQLTSPEWTPTYAGFSPRPAPRLIAKRHTHGPALAISKGLDRDRAVDESGYQLSIFNRIGSRPMTLPEMQRLYLRNGQIYTVSEAKK